MRIGDLRTFADVRFCPKRLKVREVETLPHMFRSSEIECATRNDVVDMPCTSVVLPLHSTPKLPLKMLSKLFKCAAKQSFAPGELGTAFLDPSANLASQIAANLLCNALPPSPAFGTFPLSDSISVFTVPTAIGGVNLPGIACTVGFDELPIP